MLTLYENSPASPGEGFCYEVIFLSGRKEKGKEKASFPQAGCSQLLSWRQQQQHQSRDGLAATNEVGLLILSFLLPAQGLKGLQQKAFTALRHLKCAIKSNLERITIFLGKSWTGRFQTSSPVAFLP